jgi:hypothetical protein
MKSAPMPHPTSFLMAETIAKGHFETGCSRYELLDEHIRHRPRELTPDGMRRMQELAVPAATNLALALELTLKILHARVAQSHYVGGYLHPYPGREHDIAKLGRKQLPARTLEKLRSVYQRLLIDPKKPEMHVCIFTWRDPAAKEPPNLRGTT